MRQKLILIFSFFFLSVFTIYSQEDLKQTLRGVVVDRESQIPLPGVNIILPESDPQQGTISDENGYFRFDSVNLGRQTIQASYVGYKTQIIDNVIISSAKEKIIKIEL